jgi:transcriptional regulator with XRE-family HTH domain
MLELIVDALMKENALTLEDLSFRTGISKKTILNLANDEENIQVVFDGNSFDPKKGPIIYLNLPEEPETEDTTPRTWIENVKTSYHTGRMKSSLETVLKIFRTQKLRDLKVILSDVQIQKLLDELLRTLGT